MSFPVSEDDRANLYRCMAWAARSSQWMSELKPDQPDTVTVRLEDFLAIAAGLERIRDELAGALTEDMEPVRHEPVDARSRAARVGLQVLPGGKK